MTAPISALLDDRRAGDPGVTDDGTTRVVRASGELDMVTTPELVAALSQANGHSSLLCNLGQVTFMDSSGIRALVTLSRAEPERFALGTTSEPVERLLDLSGLSTHFRRAG